MASAATAKTYNVIRASVKLGSVWLSGILSVFRVYFSSRLIKKSVHIGNWTKIHFTPKKRETRVNDGYNVFYNSCSNCAPPCAMYTLMRCMKLCCTSLKVSSRIWVIAVRMFSFNSSIVLGALRKPLTSDGPKNSSPVVLNRGTLPATLLVLYARSSGEESWCLTSHEPIAKNEAELRPVGNTCVLLDSKVIHPRTHPSVLWEEPNTVRL